MTSYAQLITSVSVAPAFRTVLPLNCKCYDWDQFFQQSVSSGTEIVSFSEHKIYSKKSWSFRVLFLTLTISWFQVETRKLWVSTCNFQVPICGTQILLFFTMYTMQTKSDLCAPLSMIPLSHVYSAVFSRLQSITIIQYIPDRSSATGLHQLLCGYLSILSL